MDNSRGSPKSKHKQEDNLLKPAVLYELIYYVESLAIKGNQKNLNQSMHVAITKRCLLRKLVKRSVMNSIPVVILVSHLHPSKRHILAAVGMLVQSCTLQFLFGLTG